MNKLIAIILIFALSLLAVSCGKDGEGTLPASAPGQGANAEGYAFIYKGNPIRINDDMAPILTALGEPVSYFEAASCAFEGLDKTYTYPGVEIYTWPDGELDRVLMLVFLDDTVETAEGITVGAAAADVLEAYGDECAEGNNSITCTRGGTTISFILENGTVAAVDYSAAA